MPKKRPSDTSAQADAAPAAAPFVGFPDPPDEKHLTVEGAILDSFGKLEAVAYTSLKEHFANEPHRNSHPVHENPGTKAEEQGQLEGLKWWSDPRGEGWKVSLNGKEKCLSVGKFGSWRLAFLLARLQRDVWLRGCEVASSSHTSTAKAQKPQAAKPAQEAKEAKEAKAAQEAKEAKEAKAAKASKEAKAARESKHASEAKAAKATVQAQTDESAKESTAARELKHAVAAQESKPTVQARADETAKEPQPRALVQKTLDVHMKPGMHPELLPNKRPADPEPEASTGETSDASTRMEGVAPRDVGETIVSPAKKLCKQSADDDTLSGAVAAPQERQDQVKVAKPGLASSVTVSPQGQSSRTGEEPVASPPSSSSFKGFPLAPEDLRLTVDGAILEENGKLTVKQYVEFKSYFENEAPAETHPVETKPGITLEEKDQLSGLRCWSDPKGMGWIAMGNGLNKWFSANTWGSWRLAFVLAKLQVAVWSKHGGAGGALRPASLQKVGLRKTPKMKLKAGLRRVKKGKGKRLRGRAAPTSRVSASHREPRNWTAPAHSETGAPPDGKRPRGRPRGRFVPRSAVRRAQAVYGDDDDTPLAMLLPRKMKEGFKMDPRSKLIQQKRWAKAGLKSKSSFDSLGEVIDEARSKTQLDIHILAGASSNELNEIGVSNALTAEELSGLTSRRNAAADSAPSSSSSSSAALPESSAHRTLATDDDLLAQCQEEVQQLALENDSDATPNTSEEDLPRSQAASGAKGAAPSDHGSSSDALPKGAKNGPGNADDVDAVIAELLKIGAMY